MHLFLMDKMNMQDTLFSTPAIPTYSLEIFEIL